MKGSLARTIGLTLAAVLAVSSPAAAKPKEPHGKSALQAARERPDTSTLRDLYRALPSLKGDDRREAEAILSRPDDDAQDPAGTHKYTAPPGQRKDDATAHFTVHWVTSTEDAPDLTDTDADNVPDYVETLQGILENEVYPCENGTTPDGCGPGRPGLGWREAANDGDGKVDVYIQNIFPTSVFGYVAIDPGQIADPAVPHTAYMVLDKDYSRYAGGSAAGGVAAAQVTAAHEYNHILQNAYDFAEDTWMFESGAVWMEDKVYPAINDYLRYLNTWVGATKVPLTRYGSSGAEQIRAYGSAVWNHWLDRRFGQDVIREAWNVSAGSGDFAPAAYNLAIGAAGGPGFADEFATFAAQTAEWRTPGAGFPDTYPEVNRDGLLPVGSVTAPFILPHTTYALFDVPVPPDSPPSIRLLATLPSGVRGAVALVGRTGGDSDGGAVTRNIAQIGAGGSGATSLDNPSAFGRITAVIVNSDVRVAGFDSAADDWTFLGDAENVTATIQAPGPPVVATVPASGISDHGAILNGSVDPHLLDTSYHFEYGVTAAYDHRTADQTMPAATLGQAAGAAQVTDLLDDTIYHFRIVASNPSGTVAGPDLTFRTAEDKAAPIVALGGPRVQRIKRVRSRGVAFTLRCSERCTGTARIEIGRRTARKLKLGKLLGKLTVRLAAKPKSTTFRVRLSARTKKRLAALRSLRSLKVTLRVRLADRAGNRRSAVRGVLLRR